MRRQWIGLLFRSIFSFAAISSMAFSAIDSSYSDHCGAFFPESIADGGNLDSYDAIEIRGVIFRGGDEILSISRFFSFRSIELYRTRNPGVLGVKGRLILRGGGVSFDRRNFTRGRGLLRVVRPRGPGVVNRARRVSFDLSGFWSASSGKLCMVGAGVSLSSVGKLLDLSAVLKLTYPNASTINSALVTGTVESLDPPGSSSFFSAISLLAYSQRSYDYTLIPIAQKMSSNHVLHGSSLALGADDDLCSILRRFAVGLRFSDRSGCLDRNCSHPSHLSLGGIQCSHGGNVHAYVVFSDSQSLRHILDPEKMLLSEGFWDNHKNHLSLLACKVLNSGLSIGDCSLGLRLWFPSVLSIENRSPLVGQIWSIKNSTDPFYFETFDSNIHPVSGLRYEYTKVDLARKYCGSDDAMVKHGKIYPDGRTMIDLRFHMGLRSSGGSAVWAYAQPVSIGDAVCGIIYGDGGTRIPSGLVVSAANDRVLNVSYKITGTFTKRSLSMMDIAKDIYTEGIYNEETGNLCMVGCIHDGHATNCSMIIEVQLIPLNPEAGDRVNGTIKSVRNRSDPLYFKPLEIYSNIMYRKQAVESIHRMDVEAAMILISLSLTCICTGLQLFHARENPNTVPVTSIIMLVLLALRHAITLLVSLRNPNQENDFLGRNSWLEANGVTAKLLTAVAFVLHLGFLQLVLSARSQADEQKALWVAERRTLKFCLPVYSMVLLMSWFGHKSHDRRSSLREELVSYVGVLADGFLLPQILLYLFSKSKEKVLVPAYYAGITMVRGVPHLYDAYTVVYYVPRIYSTSYPFGSSQWGVYSSTWNIGVPCGGFVLAALFHFLQRLGGSRLLPESGLSMGNLCTK